MSKNALQMEETLTLGVAVSLNEQPFSCSAMQFGENCGLLS